MTSKQIIAIGSHFQKFCIYKSEHRENSGATFLPCAGVPSAPGPDFKRGPNDSGKPASESKRSAGRVIA